MSFICEERLYFFDVNMKRERERRNFFFKDNEFFYGVTAAAHKHKFNRNYLSIFILLIRIIIDTEMCRVYSIGGIALALVT